MVVNGWSLYAHPLILDQLASLSARVEASAKKHPETYQQDAATRLLATIHRYLFEIIPRDSSAAEFRQGNTLGKDSRHWHRAKLHARYRLFFRFSTREKVIIYAWVNDEATLRKAGAKSDPYSMFRSMLEAGDPPATMQDMLRRAKSLRS